MSLSNAAETAILQLIFQAVTWATVARNDASPVTNLYLSLHTADPGEAGDQTTNEITYTSYARVALVRTSSGWTVSGNTVTPVSAVNFPAGTGGSGTATYFGVGTASSGAGTLIISGTITPNLICGSGITPQLSSATSMTLD